MRSISVYSEKRVASARSSGGAGYEFERQVQALLGVLMLCDGELAIAPGYRISLIQFQVKNLGFSVDDACVRMVDPVSKEESKILVQAKISLKYLSSCDAFTETIQAAWRDFTKKGIFNSERDFIVIATGPLRDDDRGVAEWITDSARVKSVENFLSELHRGAGISENKKRFYKLICDIVHVQDSTVVEEEIVRFLRRLYIFQPDTEYGKGLTESFAVSLISKTFSDKSPDYILALMRDLIGHYNSNAGEITKEVLEEKLKLTIRDRQSISALKRPELPRDSGVEQNIMALLSVIGSWDDSSPFDNMFVAKFLGVKTEAFNQFKSNLIQSSPSLLTIFNGIARVSNRRSIWRRAAPYVSADDLKRVAKLAIRMFGQVNEVFNQTKEERESNPWSGGKIEGSKILREGLSIGIAMCATDINRCTQISCDERNSFPVKIIRRIFKDSDWRLWATLDDMLPYLAEAAPDEYLACLRTFLHRRVRGLPQLYIQEERGLFGKTYILGIVNSLAMLAWFPNLLADTLSLLGEMAMKDKGGQWNPRPIDIFRRVLHPLAPHTWATSKKRMSVVKGIVKAVNKEVARKVIDSLLPTDYYSFTEGAIAPVFRCNGRSTKIAQVIDAQESWEQFNLYCQIAINLCGCNDSRLASFVTNAIDGWDDPAFNALADYLKYNKVKLSEEVAYKVWMAITKKLEWISEEDSRGIKIKWDNPRIVMYKNLCDSFKPTNAILAARPLFSWDAYSTKNKKMLEDSRVDSINKIYRTHSIAGVLSLVSSVECPGIVGLSLGKVRCQEIDSLLLPSRMDDETCEIKSFVSGYATSCFEDLGWPWVESLGLDSWSQEEVAQFFYLLPCSNVVWSKLSNFVKDVDLYWRLVKRPIVDSLEDLQIAVRGLIKARCNAEAVDTIGRELSLNMNVPSSLVVDALESYIENGDYYKNSASLYELEKCIQEIQKDNSISVDRKVKIEWAFIDIANASRRNGFIPITLEKELSRDPSLFNEALKIAYLSENVVKAKAVKEEMSESDQRRISNVWRLLYNWRIVPGALDDGGFDGRVFSAWTKKAFKLAKENKRLKPAMIALSQVLISAVREESDFWLPHEVAALLNKKSNSLMLSHFRVSLYNSRGAHTVDYSGKEDEALAAKYDNMADTAEGEGYFALAKEMRLLATMIRNDFKRLKEEHENTSKYYAALHAERESARAAIDDAGLQ